MSENRTQNELVLSPGEYAYTQDLTSGILKTHTGPSVVNVTGQEYPVRFDPKTGKYPKVNLNEAAQQFVMARQGQYIVLSNPAQNNKQPDIKSKAPAAELSSGQRVIIQGPATFALWPGQSAEVVDGHNLRSNQYLLIRVYDETAARDNWTKGVIKAAAPTDSEPDDKPTGKKGAAKASRTTMFDRVPEDLTVGKQYIVQGNEFSFYIPPTGVEVLKDERDGFVRDAVTLERLEYCILIDENGTKRYERGPKVVFPAPTERFYEETNKQGERVVVFQPIELNEIQGLHVKVNSDYTDEAGQHHKEGEELFIRGDKTPIYFPRPEHSIVSYDRKHKHFATAVPAGEARYVLERKEGLINKVEGPTMLLPDPRSQVIVRRVLTEKQCSLWYPGNLEAAKYNATLREMSRATSSTRGAISEGEVTRSRKVKTAAVGDAMGFADRSTTHSDTLAVGVEEFERASTYTEPRTVTLDTKFAGVPTIDLLTGYAVMVVSSNPRAEIKRRVEIGPRRILLEYDETLETLSMSTGKPKSTDSLIQTPYLRVRNNQIGDIIRVETRDHVNAEFKVSLRGDFTGEPTKWFEAENYVKLVSDHVRSVAKAAARLRTIEELYADPASFLRDAILGARTKDNARRSGMLFEENGFHLLDVDVLGFSVGDDRIAKILDNTQHSVVESNIGLALAEKKLQIDKRQEELNRERAEAKAETTRTEASLQSDLEAFLSKLSSEKVGRDLGLAIEKLNAQVLELKKREETQSEEQKLLNERLNQELSRRKLEADLNNAIQGAMQELALAKTREETAQVVARFTAASGPFAEALVALGNQDILARVAEAQSVQNIIGGKNLVESLHNMFAGTPLEGAAMQMISKALPKGQATNGAKA